jgi:hypothetical protein
MVLYHPPIAAGSNWKQLATEFCIGSQAAITEKVRLVSFAGSFKKFVEKGLSNQAAALYGHRETDR